MHIALAYKGDIYSNRLSNASNLNHDRFKKKGRTRAKSARLFADAVRTELVAKAEAIAQAAGDRPAFEALLKQALAVSAGRTDLSSQIMRQRAQWLLDNFYLVETHIRIAKHDLPANYSLQLPQLDNGPSTGLPRVYDIALETISHGDGRIDAESFSRFVEAYQQASTLTLGELWAIPIMLRLALIENLRRVASRVIADWNDCNLAESWADRLAEIAEQDAKSVVLTVADMARSAPPMTSSFVAELTRRLQGQSAALALPLTWIEQRLSESGLTIEQMVQSENQQQAADQVSISNSIGSLRFLSTMDWRTFVEDMSVVEQRLREDPMAVYAQMDFGTRDAYRHVVEKIARGSRVAEERVATIALDLARTAPLDGPRTHVGYWLVGDVANTGTFGGIGGDANVAVVGNDEIGVSEFSQAATVAVEARASAQASASEQVRRARGKDDEDDSDGDTETSLWVSGGRH